MRAQDHFMDIIYIIPTPHYQIRELRIVEVSATC